MGFRRSQERSSCPTEKFTSGGSYLLLNPTMSVRPYVTPFAEIDIIGVALPSYSHLIGGTVLGGF